MNKWFIKATCILAKKVAKKHLKRRINMQIKIKLVTTLKS